MEHYDVVERVMRPLALRQTRRPRSDHGKARHFVSSTSAHHNLGSLSHQGDDDEDDGASRQDPWLDDLAVNHKFPRLYALDNYKQITVVDKINHASMVDTFCRPLRGGAEEEQLNFLLSYMDGLILTNIPNRWVCSLEVTVCLDKLPTRLKLSLKGIDMLTIVCPLCHASVEFGSHIFFSCPMARQLWRKLMNWWELEDIDLAYYDDCLLWLNSSRLSKQLKEIFEGVCYVKWWLIWRFRNQLLFGVRNPSRELLFDDLI
ncbi:RNA-directed DNA polymerase, eukaryota [Tanacetum coccineum]